MIRAAYRQVFERDIVKGYSQVVCPVEATQVRQGQISMREFIRALGRSKEYQKQFYGRFSNSRAVELAFRHFLGRGISSREEFTRYFDIVSAQGLPGLVDSLVNSMEYARVFGEETVPYTPRPRRGGQESAAGAATASCSASVPPSRRPAVRDALCVVPPAPGGSAPLRRRQRSDLGLTYGAIFPSGTAKVATRPAPFSYDTAGS